jgi:hypothetical protein
MERANPLPSPNGRVSLKENLKRGGNLKNAVRKYGENYLSTCVDD